MTPRNYAIARHQYFTTEEFYTTSTSASGYDLYHPRVLLFRSGTQHLCLMRGLTAPSMSSGMSKLFFHVLNLPEELPTGPAEYSGITVYEYVPTPAYQRFFHNGDPGDHLARLFPKIVKPEDQGEYAPYHIRQLEFRTLRAAEIRKWTELVRAAERPYFIS